MSALGIIHYPLLKNLLNSHTGSVRMAHDLKTWGKLNLDKSVVKVKYKNKSLGLKANQKILNSMNGVNNAHIPPTFSLLWLHPKL